MEGTVLHRFTMVRVATETVTEVILLDDET